MARETGTKWDDSGELFGGFQAQVALAAIRGDSTASELAAKHSLLHALISNGKTALLNGAESSFAASGKPAAADRPDTAELFEQIGRLKMELEWLKNSPTADAARGLVDEAHPCLGVRRQCELLGLSRTSYYHEAAPQSPEGVRLMNPIGRQYTDHPFYGAWSPG